MKRQHPDNPELFWCPKCKTYKARGEFGFSKTRKHNVAARCKFCCRGLELNKERRKESAKKYRESHKKECHDRSVAWRRANKDHLNRLRNQELPDYYVVHCMRATALNPTSDLIELKRQQIIMKRTLKEFKTWRKEHESNNADVQREQRADEEADGRQGHA